MVVDKPVGVAAHPSPGWTGPTVIGGLAAMGHTIATSGAAERQGVVHRLDVGTTGLMVVAKSEQAYSALKRAFKEREVEKRYHAVVQGHLDPLRGTIDAPIDRHPGHDYKWAVVSGGKPSVTHYDTLEAFPAASLLDVKLETGRTHQIRVHFSALRHPCVGDLTYGADPTLSARLGAGPAVAARPGARLHPPARRRIRVVPQRLPAGPDARPSRSSPPDARAARGKGRRIRASCLCDARKAMNFFQRLDQRLLPAAGNVLAPALPGSGAAARLHRRARRRRGHRDAPGGARRAAAPAQRPVAG